MLSIDALEEETGQDNRNGAEMGVVLWHDGAS
jgi:hypothetical protein